MEGGHFKVGDEVTLADNRPWYRRAPRWMFWRKWEPVSFGPKHGQVYVVLAVMLNPAERCVDPSEGPQPGLIFAEWYPCAFDARRFRKVIRRSISEWLETSTGCEEPRRVPAPREVEGV